MSYDLNLEILENAKSDVHVFAEQTPTNSASVQEHISSLVLPIIESLPRKDTNKETAKKSIADSGGRSVFDTSTSNKSQEKSRKVNTSQAIP